MIISHKYKFIFIKTLKTAGTSIEVYFSSLCGEGDILTPISPPEEGHVPRNHEGFYNHMPAFQIRTKVDKAVWNEYFKFCFDRNPWDKMISQYHSVNSLFFGQKLTFDDFMRRTNLWPFNYPLYTENGNHKHIIVDHVARYEDLSTELQNICGNLGIPFSGALKIYAKSQYRKDNRTYQEVLSQNYREIIEKVFEIEIDLLRYAF